MSSPNGNESAYPQQLVEDRHGDLQPASAFYDVGGLTKRELIAAMAMQGMFTTKQAHHFAMDPPCMKHLAGCAVMAADALLAALKGDGQ